LVVENRRDLLSTAVALAGFYCFFLCRMFLIIHQYSTAGLYLAGAAGCAAVLYHTWYRRL
jgi:hypothetical protein